MKIDKGTAIISVILAIFLGGTVGIYALYGDWPKFVSSASRKSNDVSFQSAQLMYKSRTGDQLIVTCDMIIFDLTKAYPTGDEIAGATLAFGEIVRPIDIKLTGRSGRYFSQYREIDPFNILPLLKGLEHGSRLDVNIRTAENTYRFDVNMNGASKEYQRFEDYCGVGFFARQRQQ